MTSKQKQIVESFYDMYAVLAKSEYCPPDAKQAGVRLIYMDRFDWSGDLPTKLHIKRVVVWPDGETDYDQPKLYQEDTLQAVHDWLTTCWTFQEPEDHEGFCERFGINPNSGLRVEKED